MRKSGPTQSQLDSGTKYKEIPVGSGNWYRQVESKKSGDIKGSTTSNVLLGGRKQS